MKKLFLVFLIMIIGINSYSQTEDIVINACKRAEHYIYPKDGAFEDRILVQDQYPATIYIYWYSDVIRLVGPNIDQVFVFLESYTMTENDNVEIHTMYDVTRKAEAIITYELGNNYLDLLFLDPSNPDQQVEVYYTLICDIEEGKNLKKFLDVSEDN